jgi:hypothetical protein
MTTDDRSKRAVILVVEDSPTQAEKLQYLLEEHDYSVVVARDGKAALAAARRCSPTLILSDVVMPELDGYGLCRAIRADDGLKDIPIVLLTSLASAEDIVKGLGCGADNFIRKPCEDDYLLSRLDAILLGRALRGEQKVQLGVEVRLGGNKYFITAERQQMLDMLVLTYEEIMHANERLRTVNQELEAFSYSVSHDLRAPLRRIDGFSQALIENYGDKLDAEGRDHLQRVRVAARHMADLIDDLLKLSRVGRSEMSHEQVDLSALAREVADELRRTQPDRRVDFVIADGLVARGDGRLLRVVFENLLGNAWKFTSRRPDVRIEFSRVPCEDRQAYVVRDNGAGFDMAYASRLFAPFQRLHTEDEFPGTGIGLATAQRVVHKHGGRIWAESEAGHGATFYFTL